MSTIDEIKARVDIIDLVSETVQLRRSGKNYTGFCPFHSNTRTPAFVVFPETGSWRCFGQCNEGGDIFGFVMKKEGWDFGEALKFLAEKAGVDLKPSSYEEQVLEANQALRDLLEDAVIFYRHNLLNTPAGNQVLDYLHRQRNLSDETIETFGLGYAPNAWEAGLSHFRTKGYPEADLVACGLVTQREAEGDASRGVYDRFRHRLMIPIRDERGRMAGFGARVVDPQDVPKFLNSPQTVLFDKGRLLYGLDRARKAIRARDQAVIVEGYLDVIALHQAGFANAVSPMGTALTEAQLRMLKRFSRRMVLALDADAAGDQATLRGLQIARQAMDRSTDPVFDARGLLGYEGRLQADIRVTALPAGMDPDEVVAQDSSEWERIIAGARPIVIHVMETLAHGSDLEDSKVKSEIAAQVLPLVEEVADPVEREDYRQRLARLLQVDERALLEATRPAQGRARARTRAVTDKSTREAKKTVPAALPALTTNDLLEGHCISILLRRPDMVFRIDRALQENGLARLSMDDFQSANHQVLFGLIGDSLVQVHAEPLMFVLNGLSLPLMELTDQLLRQTQKLDPNEARVLEDVIRTLLVLRQRRLHQQMDHLRYLMEEAQRGGDSRVGDYQKTMFEYVQARSRLDRAYGRYTVHVI
ncbi:MAG TPA: DNA primase [Anaerolineales bacterium]|nr:DNA primase [Anaerolineales bacterium]